MALVVATEILSNGEETRHYRAGYEPEIWHRGSLLGSGGYGEVWQENLVSGSSQIKVRAVKKISKGKSSEKDLQRELEIVLAFSDMNKPEFRECFVGCYCWFQDATSVYIAMECFPHGDLQSFIDEQEKPGPGDESIKKKKPGLETEAAMIITQVAQALQYMHRSRVVYRDLKPQNILVSTPGPNWHVKLTDFGVSKNLQNTLFSSVAGTDLYKAPELYGRVELGFTTAVDIWSLGVVAFCIRTGNPPFRSLHDIFLYNIGGGSFPIDSLASSTDLCRDFIVKAMDKLPSQRPSIDQVMQHEWIRLSSTNKTINSSSAVLDASRWDVEDFKSWGSLANSSNQDANVSSFTVQPFKGQGLSDMTDRMSLGAASRAPVQNTVSIPLRPTIPQQQPHSQPVIAGGHPPQVQMAIDTPLHRDNNDEPLLAPYASAPHHNSLPLQNYSSPSTSIILPTPTAPPPENASRISITYPTTEASGGRNPPIRLNTTQRGNLESSSSDIDREAEDQRPPRRRDSVELLRSNAQSRTDSGYQTNSSHLISEGSRTRVVTPPPAAAPELPPYFHSNPRTTCLTCGKKFYVRDSLHGQLEDRDSLYDHLEEEQHAVDPKTGIKESYVRPEKYRRRQREMERNRSEVMKRRQEDGGGYENGGTYGNRVGYGNWESYGYWSGPQSKPRSQSKSQTQGKTQSQGGRRFDYVGSRASVQSPDGNTQTRQGKGWWKKVKGRFK